MSGPSLCSNRAAQIRLAAATLRLNYHYYLVREQATRADQVCVATEQHKFDELVLLYA